jgi:hypothetical protein
MNSTLTKVQRLWLGAQGEEIAECIDLLEDRPREAIECLVRNNTLRKKVKQIANTSSESLKKAFINLYRRVSSTQFIELLQQLDIDGIALKQKILLDVGVIQMFKQIDEAVKNALKPREANTSVVYLSAENVQRSEVIEDARIDTYESILWNFEDFKIFNKDSASSSIIFTANFKDSDNMAVPLINPLYFKVFPTGTTRSYNEHNRADYVDVEHDTDGLEFEKYAYNELFKLTEYNVTPNILCKAATSDLVGLNDFIVAIPPDRRAKFMTQIKEYNEVNSIEPNNSIWEETSVIITQPGGAKLYEKIKLLTPVERKQVMFQLIYTLYVFEQIEFSHGDLHLGNIFIVDIPESEMIYIVNGVQYRFKTTKLIKIYDFDHGTICKTTSIKINTSNSFTIEEKLNSNRGEDGLFNIEFAETNIFNKNLDIVIALNALRSEFHLNSYKSFKMFSDLDEGFDQFIRECFPGFDSANPLSAVKVYNTYSNLLTEKPELRYESNRIFGIDIADATEIGHYGISDEIMDMTWLKYFKKVGKTYGRIIKDEEEAENNHLWIPDTIIIPKEDMLRNGYFSSLHSTLPIDIRYHIVYTIDNRIL